LTANRERKQWPPWWEWELYLKVHVLERMEERRFTEVDLRRMMEYATDYRRSHTEGRWVIETKHEGRSWHVIVEPNSVNKLLEVITAYAVKRKGR
jgi:hypothetical protein